MAKQALSTKANLHGFWLTRAAEYEREAAKYTARAAEAREKAQQYLSPAPSEAESPATPL